MKDLTAGQNPLATTVSHNKRQSQDKAVKQASSNLNALDTYNKLLQLMNEKVLKNVNNAVNTGAAVGSRGKSTDKTSL